MKNNACEHTPGCPGRALDDCALSDVNGGAKAWVVMPDDHTGIRRKKINDVGLAAKEPGGVDEGLTMMDFIDRS